VLDAPVGERQHDLAADRSDLARQHMADTIGPDDLLGSSGRER
jgi:hypothetical protein